MKRQSANIINKKIKNISAAELPLNNDGSVYHLHLLPGQVADTVLLVGDPDRVALISSYFDNVEFEISNREFVSCTGTYNEKRISVLSTGIGTDNIDIAINELDAVVNYNLEKRCLKESLRTLNLIRIGTSGSIHRDVPIDSCVISKFGMGLDNLAGFYDIAFSEREKEMQRHFIKTLNWEQRALKPYFVEASEKLFDVLHHGMHEGITVTAPGFYGPQGRSLRLPLSDNKLISDLSSFTFEKYNITNFEMETSALYALGRSLGHHCCSCCAIVANRSNGTFSKNHKEAVSKLVEKILACIS